jgi:UDP-glucose 4-epimerase
LAFYEGDCTDKRLLLRILRDENIHAVVHFAAFKAVGESMRDPLRYYANNVNALLILLDAMLEAGVAPLLFSSSCTVYGLPDAVPVTEESPVKPPMSVYGNTKQIGEAILRDAVGADLPLRVLSLRYFNPIGAHASGRIGELPKGVPNNLVPYLTQAVAGLRPPLTVHGADYDTPDGTCIRDYIHVVDLAEAHVAALNHLTALTPNSYYDVVNVGTGQGASVFELLRAFERATGRSVPHVVGPRRAGDVPVVYADASRAERLLGWKARLGLEDALRDAWRWQCNLVTAAS